MENPQQRWVQERLDLLLDDLPAPPPGPAPQRSEIIRRLSEIEAALT